MSSILTNSSAMVALQTLKGINSGLEDTQSEIATGKSVADAKDNSAVWAISKVMESDVSGFKSISDSLSLGESTVAVAQQAAETITDLLIQVKEKVAAATGDNVDRTKLNSDVTALKEQIASVVSAAQFNGLNLVDGNTSGTDVLSSLDRDSSGNVTASYITVSGQDLSTGGYTAKAAFTGTTGVAADDADAFGFSLDGTGGTADSGTVVIADPTYAAGDKITMRVGESEVSYTVTASDVASTTTEDIIAVGLKSAIEATGENVTVDYDSSVSGTLVITNSGTESVQVGGQFTNAGSGGLGALAGLDVSSLANAQAALSSIETLTQTAIDAAAAFGSDAAQVEIQSNFVSKLTDSLKTGIGSMVDANMEEASARLQALQVQQQLGIQALSIANEAPQSVLSLFR
ncbi:flagellin [Meridianimarinicoccus aquatilis]|uniref:Flagellin n=1 Tax=Meridianimarinicoccus aquatilis TaxID=2552766 RepID=A0A4R6AND0_9RHOB|nr:flagellin [Fluviibacterium aquatile]QIE40875.1 flagellin [Rhodobacteraceae bacterium SC52]TDL84922.1 flagellin [Fluviibacterium aquatile]TDL87010.1 flagellin [Fluviibacterium aquatile]